MQRCHKAQHKHVEQKPVCIEEQIPTFLSVTKNIGETVLFAMKEM